MTGDVIDFELERNKREVEEKIKRLFEEAKSEYGETLKGKENLRNIDRLSLLIEYISIRDKGLDNP